MVLAQESASLSLDPVMLAMIGVLLMLAALAWLVLRQTTRISVLEERIGELEPLHDLPDTLEALATDLRGRDIHERLRGQLTETAEAQARLAGLVDDLGGRIDNQGKLVREWGATMQAGAADLPLEDISLVAARHLGERGFEAVRLLTERSRIEGRSGTLAFEARRDGVMHKGHVVVTDGVVRKESVRAAYSAFP